MLNAQYLDDLEACTGFVSQAQYPSNMTVLNAELTLAQDKFSLIDSEARWGDEAQAKAA